MTVTETVPLSVSASVSAKKRILFVHNLPQRFVVIDRDLFRERYTVQEYYQRGRLINLFALIPAVLRCQLVFCWFASWHSFAPVLLAKLFGKPTIVVVGGYDSANVPEAGYGAQRGGFKKFVTRTVIRSARQIITFSDYARKEAIAQSGANPDRTMTVYLGVPALDPALTDYPAADKRADQILTVGGIRQENLVRKGLLPFVQTARLLPDLHFIHAGATFDPAAAETLKAAASANVTFSGGVSDEKLGALYRTAKIYVQASVHEGFGMSVAEAMLAYCIPVVTRVGSLPEVVGETGIYAESNAPEAIAAAIRTALSCDPSLAEAARARILSEFPLQRRRQTLYALIDRLCPDPPPAKGVA